MTGNPEIDLDWVLPTQACLVVSNGAMINFIGDFSLHPLSGGSPGAPLDDDITNLDQSGPQATYIPATFGAHPFFCTIHSTSMQGVIYVVD
jgi:plastocyanin